MRFVVQTQFVSIRLSLSLIIFSLLFSLGVLTGQAQQTRKSEPAITKEDFLSALELGQAEGRKAAYFITRIRQRGVDFRVTSEDEKQIRQIGKYLGTIGLNELIKALDESYHAYKGERLKVSLFNYASCKDYQEQFTELLDSKIKSLSGILSSSGNQYEYIARLTLVTEGRPPIGSLDDINRYWETTHSLQILSGICDKKDNDVLIISQVFLGDLRGRLHSPLRITFKYDTKEYAVTKDVHSLLILYSLARDAQERGLDRELIRKYLVEATNIIEQLKDPEYRSILQPVRDAITDMYRDIGVTNLVDIQSHKGRIK